MWLSQNSKGEYVWLSPQNSEGSMCDYMWLSPQNSEGKYVAVTTEH